MLFLELQHVAPSHVPYTSVPPRNTVALYVMSRFRLLCFFLPYHNFHSSIFSGILVGISLCVYFIHVEGDMFFISLVLYTFLKVYSQNRLIASSCLSVRPPAWNNSAPTGGIFMKLYI